MRDRAQLPKQNVAGSNLILGFLEGAASVTKWEPFG
jgi:hypothetical protein